MAVHASTLAWRIPGTEEPGGLQPMGSRRAGRDWETEQTALQRAAGAPWGRGPVTEHRAMKPGVFSTRTEGARP